MPYIKPSKRAVLNPAIKEIVRLIKELNVNDQPDSTAGNINYVCTKIIHKFYPGKNYDQTAIADGIIGGIEKEYYRQVTSPYEDQKEFDNGEVYVDDI